MAVANESGLSHNSAVTRDHDQLRHGADDEALAVVDALRQRAREAVERAQQARDRVAAQRIDALVAELESTAKELDGLRTAMGTRSTIEQAKGVLMGLHGCGADEAFQQLVRMSQGSQQKLHDVAALVVAEAANGQMRLRSLLGAASPTAHEG